MRISDWSSDVCSSDLLRGQVELAGHVGVGAAARERDQAAFVVRAQAVGAVPDPVLAFGLVQRVEGEQGFPLRLVLAVLLERRSEEHTSELQSLMRISYAVFCLKKKTNTISAKSQ